MDENQVEADVLADKLQEFNRVTTYLTPFLEKSNGIIAGSFALWGWMLCHKMEVNFWPGDIDIFIPYNNLFQELGINCNDMALSSEGTHNPLKVYSLPETIVQDLIAMDIEKTFFNPLPYFKFLQEPWTYCCYHPSKHAITVHATVKEMPPNPTSGMYWSIQIILYDSSVYLQPEKFIDTFDFNICKTCWVPFSEKGPSEFDRTPQDIFSDIENMQFRCSPSIESLLIIPDRIEKYRGRGFTLKRTNLSLVHRCYIEILIHNIDYKNSLPMWMVDEINLFKERHGDYTRSGFDTSLKKCEMV